MNAAGKARGGNHGEQLSLLLAADIKTSRSNDYISWIILGGKQFLKFEPKTSFDLLKLTQHGIPKASVVNIAGLLDIPMKVMAGLINLSGKTLERKKNTDMLNSIVSSHSIEIAGVLARGLEVFEDIEKLKRWLNKENRALNGMKPLELLSTPTGIKLVNNVLGRIEHGVYS